MLLNLPHTLALRDIFDSILPDFILSFTFFTAVTYAVLSKRFGEQRPAVAMSAALGMALSIGLVWWEYINGYSIRDLGPIAVGFAIIILAGVIYQAIRGSGGNWAGAGMAIGACLLIGWTLGVDWPIDREAVQTVMTVLLVGGVVAFLLHHRGGNLTSAWRTPADIHHDMRDLHQDRRIGKKLDRGLRHLKREADDLRKDPDKHRDEAVDIILQLQRILPAEGWLTERLARLRAKVHLASKGSIARIEELQKNFAELSPEAKRAAAKELRSTYKQLNLDRRLERLDAAVAENERRIRDLTRRAQQYMEAHDYRNLAGVLDEASKLQKHNTKLFALIDSSEEKLLIAARQALHQDQEVKRA